MTMKLLVVLAWLAGFGIAPSEPQPPTLARVFSKDGTGMLTLTREEIVYRGAAPNMKMILRFPVGEVKSVDRKDALIIVDAAGIGGFNDRPFTMEALDQESAVEFVTAFDALTRRAAAR
jgi:hypothetical protein